MSTYYHYYSHTAADLAAACERGAVALRQEAGQALAQGDQSRHDRKLCAAEFVDRYIETLRSGTADLDHAQVVARAANLSGILIDAPMPDDPHKQKWDPDGLRAEQDRAARRKAELHSAAAAGLLCRVADPGQVAFYALPGYEPDGYDVATQKVAR